MRRKEGSDPSSWGQTPVPLGLVLLAAFQFFLVALNLCAMGLLIHKNMESTHATFAWDVFAMIGIKTLLLFVTAFGYLKLHRFAGYWLAHGLLVGALLTGGLSPFFGFGTLYAMILLLLLNLKYRNSFR